MMQQLSDPFRNTVLTILRASKLSLLLALSPLQSAWPGGAGQGLWRGCGSVDQQLLKDPVLSPSALRATHAPQKVSANEGCVQSHGPGKKLERGLVWSEGGEKLLWVSPHVTHPWYAKRCGFHGNLQAPGTPSNRQKESTCAHRLSPL